MYRDFYRRASRMKPLYVAPTPKQQEALDGFVQGKSATADEERFARALERNNRAQSYEFRLAVGAPKGMPGWRELDFLVYTYSGWRAFEIDDTSFVHKGESARTTDRLRDISRIQALSVQGINLLAGIEHVDANVFLNNQADADRKVRDLLA